MEQPRFFFDVTDLRRRVSTINAFTGIHRTLVMVFSEFCQLQQSTDVFLSYYDHKKRAYFAISLASCDVSQLNNIDYIRSLLHLEKDSALRRPSVGKYKAGTAKYYYHLLLRKLNAALGNQKYFKKRGLSISEWCDRPLFSTKRVMEHKPIAFSHLARAKDHLFLLDSIWGESELHETLLKIKASGVVNHAMVYDLIPILHPEYCSEAFSRTFLMGLHKATSYASEFMTDSEHVKRDLKDFLKTTESDIGVIAVPLAQQGLSTLATYEPLPDDAGALQPKMQKKRSDFIGVDDEIKNILFHPYVLCVGTFETRKNQWRVAEAWRRLVHNMPNLAPRIIFVGRPGVGAGPFMNLMEATGNLGGWATLVRGPTDRDLEFLYKHCEFTIFASLAEGWGLPIGESLSYGKTAIVGRGTSLPEVGGALVRYCDAESIEDILHACSDLVCNPANRIALEGLISQMDLRSWGDVASDLLRLTQVDLNPDRAVVSATDASLVMNVVRS